MDGDPAILWQTRRDLLDDPDDSDRRLIAHQGWGARIMRERLAEGEWPNARWTGTVWTLLGLIELGFPSDD
ncbi:hypothetical protein C1Y22_37550, partial [Pseudomonas sp. MPR-R2A5]